MWLRTSTLHWNDPEDEPRQREKENASPPGSQNQVRLLTSQKLKNSSRPHRCQGKIDLRVIRPKYGGNTATSVIEGWFGKKERHAKCKPGQPV